MISASKGIKIQPMVAAFIGLPVRHHHLPTAGKTLPHNTLTHISVAPRAQFSMVVPFRRSRTGGLFTIISRTDHIGSRNGPGKHHSGGDWAHPRPGFEQTEGETSFNSDAVRAEIPPKSRTYWQSNIGRLPRGYMADSNRGVTVRQGDGYGVVFARRRP